MHFRELSKTQRTRRPRRSQSPMTVTPIPQAHPPKLSHQLQQQIAAESVEEGAPSQPGQGQVHQQQTRPRPSKRSIELAEATNTSLKESNGILKADNTDKAKKIKELEKLEKTEEKAERFKTSVLEYFQNKYEELNNKTKPETFSEFMPKSLQKYFTTGELNT